MTADTLLSVPFKYLNKKHLAVAVNGRQAAEGADYALEGAGTLRMLRRRDGTCAVVIKRITPPSENTVMSCEELADGLIFADSVSEKRFEKLKAAITGRLELTAGLLEGRLEQSASAAENRIELLKTYADDKVSGLLRDTETRLEKYEKCFADIDGRIQSLDMEAENFKKEHTARMETFARDFGRLTGMCFSGIAGLKDSTAELEKKLTRLEAEPAAAPAATRAVPSQASFSSEGLLGEIRSALNMEIQVRRREDAQIKVLLKRLLEKYQRLEDWAAGKDPDLSPGVIGAMREEMTRRCDTLGRVHLENIVRINDLKNRAVNGGAD